jgi:uncharacterized protein (DUF169 family)
MSTAGLFQDLLGLKAAPVAITFRASAPPNLRRVGSAGPAGCSYWKLAAQGENFYTEAADHYNCPIGAQTHGVDLPPERKEELEGVLGMMTSLGYIRSEEVPGIPRREGPFGVAIYGRLTDEPADVVLVRGNARQIMLLEEAAQAAGVSGAPPLMGRPTCAAVPLAVGSGRAVSSLGCIGNRIYTELADEEFYYALPGRHIDAVAGKLATIVSANAALEKYHRGRLM